MSDIFKPFAIVEFDELIENKKSVELIPVSWLTDNETKCFWPPENEKYKITELIEMECVPENTWSIYDVAIINKAKDYEQGLRRLNRSFRKKDVASSDNESHLSEKDQPIVLNSSGVASALANQRQLNSKKIKNRPFRSQSLGRVSDIEENSELEKVFHNDPTTTDLANLESIKKNPDFIAKTTSKQKRSEPEGIVDFDGLAKHMEKFIAAELEKVKRSILLTVTNNGAKILRAVEYKGELPQKTQAWKEIGADLPFDTIEKFLEFDESLKTNREKRDALMDILQMAAAGHTKYEEDVTAIMAKMLKKSVQLQYSGCGKKVRGVGKKSFKETESFKIIEEFLLAKHADSKDKLKIISVVSKFLSGASDRDGGRSQRDQQL